jgi:hypothetical protein
MAITCEADVADCLAVTHVSANATFVCHHIPDLAIAIVACAQKQMTGFGEETDALNATFMALPGVHPLFWDVTVVFLRTQVGWRVDETFACNLG